MSPTDPAWEPLKAQIRALAAKARGRESGAYVRLVRLGLKHSQKVPLGKFGRLLKEADLPAPRVSEIKAILAAKQVALQFIRHDLGIRSALKEAREARNPKADDDGKAQRPAPAAALRAIVQAATGLIQAMRETNTFQVDCGLYRVEFKPAPEQAGGGAG